MKEKLYKYKVKNDTYNTTKILNKGFTMICDKDNNLIYDKKTFKMKIKNKLYFTLAAYNAGPGNVERIRKRAAQQGYDPNIWFNNVEVVMRKSLSSTVGYVTSINRYYVIYKQLESLDQVKSLERVSLAPKDPFFMIPLRKVSQTPDTKKPLVQ